MSFNTRKTPIQCQNVDFGCSGATSSYTWLAGNPVPTGSKYFEGLKQKQSPHLADRTNSMVLMLPASSGVNVKFPL